MAIEIQETLEAGKKILHAYVLVKKGKADEAGKLFVKAVSDVSADPLLDGIAKSIQQIEAVDESV